MKRLLVLLLCLSPVVCQALIPDASREGLMVAIVQDEFRFDFSNVKNASIINNQDGTFKGLLIELKAKAVASLTKMTADGFNKELVVVFNNKVVSASVITNPLGSQILFSGLSLADAQTFLIILHNKQTQEKRRIEANNNKFLINDV